MAIVFVSVLLHASIAVGLLLAWVYPVPTPELTAVDVSLVTLPSLARPISPSATGHADVKTQPSRQAAISSTHASQRPRPILALQPQRSIDRPGLSEAQLAGAISADGTGQGGSGGGGGDCNMVLRVQAALQKDALVIKAASRLGGRAVMVWNGSWVRNEGEDGAGLSSVREAMIWEIGFSPEPCRNQPVHGLIIFPIRSGSESGRLVVGSAHWRWADLLGTDRATVGAGHVIDQTPRP